MGFLTRRHPAPCPTCGTRWEAPTARFCGRCGTALLDPDVGPDLGRHTGARAGSHASSGGRPRNAAPAVARSLPGRARVVLGTGLGAAIVIAAAAATATGEVDDVPEPADTEVALPDPGGQALAGRPSPEQQAALDRFDPDRRSCRPRGCEAWHLVLEDTTGPLDVDGDWLAVVDGSTLRRRPTRGAASLPGATGTIDDDLTALVRRKVDGELAGDPVDLAVGPDGTALVLWPDLLAAFSRAGDTWLAIPSSIGAAWHVEARGDHAVVLSDLPPDRTPEATDGHRLTGLDLADGTTRWQRDDLIPREFLPAGLAATDAEGALQLVDTSTGRTRWRRPVDPDARVQVSPGPWVVASGIGTNEDADADTAEGAVLLDVQTGQQVATRPETRLLTPIQPLGKLWGAAWVQASDQRAGGPWVTFVALDDDGRERWRVRLGSPVGGACCPAALPWQDDTVAILDPGTVTDAWVIVDAATGQRRDLPVADHPELSGGPAVGRIYVPPEAPDRLIRRSPREVAVLTRDGTASLSAAEDLEVVSTDPLVVRQGPHLLGIEPVPRT